MSRASRPESKEYYATISYQGLAVFETADLKYLVNNSSRLEDRQIAFRTFEVDPSLGFQFSSKLLARELGIDCLRSPVLIGGSQQIMFDNKNRHVTDTRTFGVCFEVIEESKARLIDVHNMEQVSHEQLTILRKKLYPEYALNFILSHRSTHGFDRITKKDFVMDADFEKRLKLVSVDRNIQGFSRQAGYNYLKNNLWDPNN